MAFLAETQNQQTISTVLIILMTFTGMDYTSSHTVQLLVVKYFLHVLLMNQLNNVVC